MPRILAGHLPHVCAFSMSSITNPWLQRYLECEHMQLFELGSVYHPQYLVNVAFPYLPLSSLPQYRGLAPLNKLALYVSGLHDLRVKIDCF